MYILRSFAILSAICVLINLSFWIGDAITGMPFRSGWALTASIFWAFVFEGAHRYFKKRKSSPKTLS
jgi:hypothetical protein